jgi:hypothetical protein
MLFSSILFFLCVHSQVYGGHAGLEGMVLSPDCRVHPAQVNTDRPLSTIHLPAPPILSHPLA